MSIRRTGPRQEAEYAVPQTDKFAIVTDSKILGRQVVFPALWSVAGDDSPIVTVRSFQRCHFVQEKQSPCGICPNLASGMFA